MIIKLLGMALVFAASGSIGFCVAECLASREKELNNLVDALELMNGELSYSALPVKDIVFKVAPRVKGDCFNMFSVMTDKLKSGCALPQAWEYALQSTAASMSLKKSDADHISEMGFLLGAYELEEQKSHFNEMKSTMGENNYEIKFFSAII